jgi:NAD(P)-dependent dehydrogenase (short-subunit alcohol dehydrogenase family)
MLERRYDGVQAYCQAKLAEVMLTIDRAAELEGSGASVNCLHPASMMPTKIVTNMFSPMSEIADGVRSVVRLGVDPELEGVTGTYFNTTRPERANPQAYDPNARARPHALAQQLTGVPAGRTTTPARAER